MASTTEEKIQPPGQTRSYPDPTTTGKIPFEYSQTGLSGETYYELWGSLSSGQTPLICLHGGPGVPSNYLLPISLIHKDYSIPVLMYHQIGCGKSTHFKDKKGDSKFWTPALFMAELDNIKTHLKIEKFYLLGQSWGGMLAGQYAIEKQPAGLQKIIVADSPSDMQLWVKTANRLREALPQDVQDTLTKHEKDGTTDSEEYEKAVEVFYGRHLCRLEPMPKELTDAFEYLKQDSTVYETMNGPSEFHVIGSLKDWSITEELKKITEKTCPGGLLLVNGHFDEAQDDNTWAYFHHPSCKTKWVRYALSSHTPQLEETERFLSDLGMFLTEKY